MTLVRGLGTLSVLETVSVVALLVNLATWHDAQFAAVLGPVHGALYVTVVVTALFGRGLSRRTRVYAVIPVLSGSLTFRQVRRELG